MHSTHGYYSNNVYTFLNSFSWSHSKYFGIADNGSVVYDHNTCITTPVIHQEISAMIWNKLWEDAVSLHPILLKLKEKAWGFWFISGNLRAVLPYYWVHICYHCSPRTSPGLPLHLSALDFIYLNNGRRWQQIGSKALFISDPEEVDYSKRETSSDNRAIHSS